MVEVNGAEVRNALQLQRDSFVDLALLCGTDFSRRIRSIGPFTALKLIRKFNSIENLLEDPQYVAKLPGADYLDDIIQARLVFSFCPQLPEDDVLEQGEYNSIEVHSLLERYGLVRVANLDWVVGENSLGTDFEEVTATAFQETGFGVTLESDFEALSKLVMKDIPNLRTESFP
jgi:flap endonuclease-1